LSTVLCSCCLCIPPACNHFSTLSLHDALPISQEDSFISHLIELRSRLLKAVGAILVVFIVLFLYPGASAIYDALAQPMLAALPQDRKSTRLNSSHVKISYAVFCLKKKKNE